MSAVNSVEVILIAYRSDPWIGPCVNSLLRSTKIDFRLLVVDNTENTRLNSLDFGSREGALVQTQKLLGFAAANNLALLHIESDSRYVVFLNQDTLSEMDWVGACVDVLDLHPEFAAVTPLTQQYTGNAWERYFLECARRSESFVDDLENGRFKQPLYEVPVVPAAAMVVRTSALRHVGPFDPVFGSYYEDYDLCHRLRRAGYLVGVCPTGTVRHHAGSATSDEDAERRRARWVVRNRLIVRQRFESRYRLPSLLLYWALEFPRGLLRSLVGRIGAKPLAPYLKAHWDLAKLSPRLASRRVDEVTWRRNLRQLGWPVSDEHR